MLEVYLIMKMTKEEREAVKQVLSLPEEKRDFVFKTMENLFVAYGITDKDGKLISRENLKAFQQMLAELNKSRELAKKPSKKP